MPALRIPIAAWSIRMGLAAFDVSSAALVTELGQISRFDHARQLMGYAGIVSREHSSGRSPACPASRQQTPRSPCTDPP